MKVSYNEQDNVTCTGCRWAVGERWPYLWQKNASAPPPGPAPAPPACKEQVLGHDLDEPGNDHSSVTTPTLEACVKACCADQGCAGALFEPESTVTFGDCKKGQPCCFMKSRMLSPRKKTVPGSSTLFALPGRSSGPQPSDNVVPPPMGLRSSPALGGIGAGSTELRSDGSFRDWTILNQGPAGSGKFGIVDDVWMAARVGKSAKVLRTHPPGYASGHGVSALTFSGSYPLTRLLVEDEALTTAAPEADAGGIETTVFGYSTLKPTDMKASAFPALALTLVVKNSGSEATTADFMYTLPFGGWTDCSRKSANGTVVEPKSAVDSYAKCMHACAEGCASWQFDEAAGTCTHNPDVPLTAHAVGTFCGVKGSGWTMSSDKKAITWTQKPEAVGPSMGTVSLAPVGSTMSFGASDDPATLFQDFASTGKFSSAPTGAVAAHGAASASAVVPAGETVTLSIVFSWHFPDRNYKASNDHSTDGLILGVSLPPSPPCKLTPQVAKSESSHSSSQNYYQNLWTDSEHVASEVTRPCKRLFSLACVFTPTALCCSWPPRLGSRRSWPISTRTTRPWRTSTTHRPCG